MADSWFGRLCKSVVGVTQAVGQDFVLERLSGPNGAPDPARQLVKDEEYVSLRVRSSRIVNVRKWTGKFYGAVHARAHYLNEARGLVDYQTVLSPSLMKDLDPERLERVITVDKPILGPVPYIGALSLELGLFSVKGGDLAGPYIDLLTTMAQTAGVGFLTQAVPFVDPLRKGLDLLFGNNNQAQLEIGVDRDWNPVQTGTWLLIRVPKGTKSIADLRLDPNDFGLIDEGGKSYREQPYIVFVIEGSDRRDDWMNIPELKRLWDAIGAAAIEGEINKAEKLFTQFEVSARWSPDLIPKDAQRLTQKAQQRLPQLQKETAVARTEQKEHPLGDFKSLDLYGSA
jgi:hypothetical protein